YSVEQIKDHWFWSGFSEKLKEFDLHESEMNTDKFHLITINCLDNNLINISKNFFKKVDSSLDVQAFWKNGFFVSKKKLNKAITIKRLAEKLNIKTDEIVAFGDGENDIQMIKMAGLGIAMSNAVSELKELANDIAMDVEEYGTYYKLKDLGII
ncbi:MAG: HAD family hydrolase, partial [Metamycoplasmataceae bacterium]